MDEEEQRRAAQAAMQPAVDLAGGDFPRPRDPVEAHSEGIVNRLLFSGDADNGRYDSSSFADAYKQAGVDVGLIPAQATPFAPAAAAQAMRPAADMAMGEPAAPGPLEMSRFVPQGAGISPELRGAMQESWDANLDAAREALERSTPRGRSEGGEPDEVQRYTDSLLKEVDAFRERRRQPQQEQSVRDPYAAQREREAVVARRLGKYDIYSSPTATRTVFTPQTAQTNAYDRALTDESGKQLFDYFM